MFLLLIFHLIISLLLFFLFLQPVFILFLHTFYSKILLKLSLIVRNIPNGIFKLSKLAMFIYSIMMFFNCSLMILINMINEGLMIVFLFFSYHLSHLMFAVCFILIPILEVLFLFLFLHFLLSFCIFFVHLIMLDFLVKLVFFLFF